MSRLIAGQCVAFCTVWLCWALLAPIVAGPIPAPAVQPMRCPMVRVMHEVGSDLRVRAIGRDLCSL